MLKTPVVGFISEVVRSCALMSPFWLSWKPYFNPLGESLLVVDGIGHR